MNRTAQLIQILLDSENPLTVKDMASQFSVSPRTIRYDLEKVDKLAQEAGVKLLKTPGVGVTLIGGRVEKNQLFSKLKKIDDEITPYSPEDRKRIILELMLTSKKMMTIEELEKVLFVSRGAVHKDLDRVESWLSKYSLELYRKQNHGIAIVGEEESIRKALAALVLLCPKNNPKMPFEVTDFKRLDFDSVSQLMELIPLNYKKLEELLIKAEKQLMFKFSYEAFISLIIHIAIAIRRTKEGKDIIFSKELSLQLQEKHEYKNAVDFCECINKEFDVELPEDEVGYILLHMLGSKNQQHSEDSLGINLEDVEDDLPVIMAREIALIASKVMDLDLGSDQQFLNGLILHLRPIIHRLKYGLTLNNPILEDIKNNYPDLLGVAWMTSTVFERYLDKKIKEDEVAYIALHIGAAVERNKKSIKVIVVCHSGIGTSEFLAARLKNAFKTS